LTFLNTVQGPVKDFWTNLDVKGHTSAWLKSLTAAFIGLDGRYVGGDTQATTTYNYTTPTNGGGAGGLPFAHSMAFTLKSDIYRGRGHIGRFYLPSGLTVDTSGRWSVNQCQLAAGPARIMLDAVNTAARGVWSTGSYIGVFSELGSGTIGEVQQVGVGRGPDSQRRRDNKIKEEHSYLTLTTAAARQKQLQEREYGDGLG